MYNVMNVWRLNEFYRQVGVIDIAGVGIFFLGWVGGDVVLCLVVRGLIDR